MSEASELYSTLTCPSCGARWSAEMPTDACVIVCDCAACGMVLRPLTGQCCVFCSYGDVSCPPAQADRRLELE